MHAAWVSPFLEALKRCGTVARAAREINISTASPYALRRTDADFAAAWDAALEDHIDACEDELTRRAFGFEEPVVYQGQLTPVWERDETGQQVLERFELPEPVKAGDRMLTHGSRPVQARNADGSLKWLTVTKHSDALLLAKVKAYRKRYSTERTELTGADGGAIETDSTARAARVAHLMALAQKRKAAEEAGSEFA